MQRFRGVPQHRHRRRRAGRPSCRRPSAESCEAAERRDASARRTGRPSRAPAPRRAGPRARRRSPPRPPPRTRGPARSPRSGVPESVSARHDASVSSRIASPGIDALAAFERIQERRLGLAQQRVEPDREPECRRITVLTLACLRGGRRTFAVRLGCPPPHRVPTVRISGGETQQTRPTLAAHPDGDARLHRPAGNSAHRASETVRALERGGPTGEQRVQHLQRLLERIEPLAERAVSVAERDEFLARASRPPGRGRAARPEMQSIVVAIFARIDG